MGSCTSTDNTEPIGISLMMQKPVIISQKHKFTAIEVENIPHPITTNQKKITDWIIKNQNHDVDEYERCLQKLASDKQDKYFDPDFPAILNSIGTQKFGQEVQWRRPNQIIKGPYKLITEVKLSEVSQGQLGDCYYFSLIQLLENHSHIVARVFERCQVNEFGAYGIWLFINGAWKLNILDDQIPCRRNGNNWEPIFCFGKTELWSMLLQKALAKSNHSYFKISSGLLGIAFNLITAAPYEYYVKDSKASRSKSYLIDMWKFIQSGLQKKYFLCASNEANDRNQNFGVVSGYSYKIIQAREISLKIVNNEVNEKLIKVLDCARKKQWRGKWSRQSSVWTPQLRNLLHLDEGEKQSFWINLDDFSKEFTNICACKYNQEYLTTYMGLAFQHKQAFKGVYLKVDSKTHGFLTLSQQYQRQFQNYKYSLARLIIMQIDEETLHMSKYINDIIDCDKDTFLEVTLDLGLYYIFIEIDWLNDQSRLMNLSFYGERAVTFMEDKQRTSSIQSLLNQIIVLHEPYTEKDRYHIYQKDQDIKKTSGSLAGYVYYHYQNNSKNNHYLIETVTLKERLSIKVHNEEKEDEFTVKVFPGEQKMVLLKVQKQKNGIYSFFNKIQYFLVESFSLEKLRQLCDIKFTKKKNRQLEGKDIDVIVKTYSYTGGVAVLYQNKMDKYAFIEQLSLEVENLQLQNQKLNAQNKIDIHLEPQKQKLLSFIIKKPAQKVTFKTTTSFYLNSPEFQL